mmetsp:Transcript_23490/g.48907  ORF Transcript_23490/g.48907 Transcript_23490/m.48907 type:complete len:111 (+) Transcript_23490:24-356(+)
MDLTSLFGSMGLFGQDGIDRMTYEQLLERFGDGSVDNSASQETIDSIPVSVIENNDEEGGSCVICMEDFKTGDKVKMLKCGHRFCVGCIDKWLKQSATCPMCKVEVEEKK